MKTRIIFLFLLLAACTLSIKAQKTVVIEQPYYEVKNSGIDNISKIELTPTQTRVYVHTTFIPHWWVKFPTATFIQPTGTEEKILAIGIEKGEFDKEIYMSESGDSTFVLIFPPLDKSVKSFNYGEEDKTIIFGVSIEKDTKKLQKQNEQQQAKRLQDAIKWIETEVAKSEPELPNYDMATFFRNDTVRIVGYIKGYKPQLGFSTGIVYASNELTREDFPIVINIHPDGRIEGNIPSIAPSIQYMRINDISFNLYTEPGKTLGIVLDWDEFLLADRYRDKRWEFKDFTFFGPLAKVNTNLLAINTKTYNWNDYEKDMKSLTPNEFKQKALDLLNENLQIIEKAKTNELSSKALTIKQNEVLVDYAYILMNFSSSREYYLREDTTSTVAKTPITDDYYDFLNTLPLNDPAFLIPSSASSFINRYEYADFFTRVRPIWSLPEISFIQFLKNEKKVIFTEEEKIIVDFIEETFGKSFTSEEWEPIQKLRNENEEAFDAFNQKYEKEEKEYYEIYVDPLQLSGGEYFRKEWESKDSVVTNNPQLMPSLVYDITKTRSLISLDNATTKEEGMAMLKVVEEAITHPFLKSEALRMFNKKFPETEIFAYELPQTAAAETFKQLIAPHKGKYILVDFWGTSCGPCIHGIKGMKEKREELKDSKDIVFLFITGESDSPSKEHYDSFVQEQGLTYTHRLSKDDYNRLRELFKFNGIPRYETVDREGRILTKSISPYSFDYSFLQLLEKEAASIF